MVAVGVGDRPCTAGLGPVSTTFFEGLQMAFQNSHMPEKSRIHLYRIPRGQHVNMGAVFGGSGGNVECMQVAVIPAGFTSLDGTTCETTVDLLVARPAFRALPIEHGNHARGEGRGLLPTPHRGQAKQQHQTQYFAIHVLVNSTFRQSLSQLLALADPEEAAPEAEGSPR